MIEDIEVTQTQRSINEVTDRLSCSVSNGRCGDWRGSGRRRKTCLSHRRSECSQLLRLKLTSDRDNELKHDTIEKQKKLISRLVPSLAQRIALICTSQSLERLLESNLGPTWRVRASKSRVLGSLMSSSWTTASLPPLNPPRHSQLRHLYLNPKEAVFVVPLLSSSRPRDHRELCSIGPL